MSTIADAHDPSDPAGHLPTLTRGEENKINAAASE
jgi:hypothetical protein